MKVPSNLNKKNALKSIIGKNLPKTLKGRLAVTGGSPFKLTTGLGALRPNKNNAILNSRSINTKQIPGAVINQDDAAY